MAALLAGPALLILAAAVFLYLMIAMPGRSTTAPAAAPNQALAALAGRLEAHVRALSEDIGIRHAGSPGKLDEAADYIHAQLQSYGHAPEETRFADGAFRNIQVTLPGTENPEDILVIGAHYDSTPFTPGADDNASGVAGLLEIARSLAGRRFSRTVRLIAFANEERPYFGTELMGSRAGARRSCEQGENIIGMLSLEMIGYYSSEPGSQHYPPGVRWFYPDQANFIGFVGNLASRSFLRRAIAAFRAQAVFPSEGMAAPVRLVPDIRRSDNSAYWDYGFPAVMITDTSNFRNPNYHTARDMAGTLDFAAMARVVSGLTGMVGELAGPP